MAYKIYFDRIDAELLKIGPRHDVMLLLVIAAAIPDDVVLVSKGATVPFDEMIIEGESSIDESFVTGKPFPVYKNSGIIRQNYLWAAGF